MPKYKTRKIRAAIKRRKAALQTVPRDKRLLMRWARKGTPKDYEKLHKHVCSKCQTGLTWTRSRSLARPGR